MKKIFILLIMSSVFSIQSAQLKKIATLAASITAAYPMLQSAYTWSQNRNNRTALINTLEDADPVVQKYIRNRLQKQSYSDAQTLPIKSYEGSFYLEAQLDGCLGLSKTYESSLKEALSRASDEEARSILGNLNVNLDHEKFHLQDTHAKKSIAARFYIPALTEIASLPITLQLLKKKNPLTFGILLGASVLAKRSLNRHLEYAHRRYQERGADRWALEKNKDSADLTAFMNFRENIVKNGFTDLYMEHARGASTTMIFSFLMKLFAKSKPTIDEQRFDTDPTYRKECFGKMGKLYAKFEQQPWQWPLRLLQYSFDPEHPFLLGDVRIIKDRIKQLEQPAA